MLLFLSSDLLLLLFYHTETRSIYQVHDFYYELRENMLNHLNKLDKLYL